MKFSLPNNRGFTLLETFVAVTILVIAVIGPLSLMVRGITDGNYAKNEITAFYLAQEGLELVMNRRDANQFGIGDMDYPNNYPWLAGLTNCVADHGCYIDVENPETVESCNTPANGELCKPFEFIGGVENEAHFVRQIGIIPGSNTITGSIDGNPIPDNQTTQYNQAEVIVTVKWMNKAAPRTLVLKDVIYARPIQEVL
ncbi:MAG: hypothetical protein HYV76_00585 [Candidatus Vogelbacteria bacterium]|nr:hypothetical protein [Candidatus Vogelbacteria bacterium]